MSEEMKEKQENQETVVAEENKGTEEKTEEKDEVTLLKEQLQKKDEEIAKLKNAYAMAYADTENTRKRLVSEYETKQKYHIQSFAKEVLPVLDNCERALAQATQDEAYRKGVQMIYDQLKNCLEKEGVVEIEAEGKPFDGNWHQALMSESKEGVEPGTVTQVLQKGYKLKDRLLRAAMVKVSE